MAEPTNISAVQKPKQLKKRSSKMSKEAELAAKAPIFLRKTYNMIDSCDPSIASWSDHGTTFVVKDTEKFAAVVIPEYFKHNNFSSFVRQLNFYGFRKIKSDPLRIKDAATNEESKYWKFRHDKFQRGRPDLLAEIRKSNHNESADKQEVETLKMEIRDLKDRLEYMANSVTALKTLVASMINGQPDEATFLANGPSKKRKTSHELPSPISSYKMVEESSDPLPVTSAERSSSVDDISKPESSRELIDIVPSQEMNRNHSIGNASFTASYDNIIPTQEMNRNESIGNVSFTASDDDILATLLSLDDLDEIRVLDDDEPVIPVSIVSGTDKFDIDPVVMDKLRRTLGNLPKPMQEMFVDRLVLAMASPDKFRDQVEALTSMAVAASEEAQRRLEAAGRSANDSKLIPLAAAVLGAYLARYVAHQTNQFDSASTTSASPELPSLPS